MMSALERPPAEPFATPVTQPKIGAAAEASDAGNHHVYPSVDLGRENWSCRALKFFTADHHMAERYVLERPTREKCFEPPTSFRIRAHWCLICGSNEFCTREVQRMACDSRHCHSPHFCSILQAILQRFKNAEFCDSRSSVERQHHPRTNGARLPCRPFPSESNCS